MTKKQKPITDIPRSPEVGSQPSRKQSRRFDEPFKRMVVDQIERLGQSQASVARSFELDPKILRRWQREYGNPSYVRSQSITTPIAGPVVTESLELLELRKRLRDSEEERDILKKALVVFSRHQR